MNEHEKLVGILRASDSVPLNFDAGTTALVVVDMQNYFTRPSFPLMDLFEILSPGLPSGYLGRVRDTVIPNIRQLLECFRGLGAPIFFTAVGTETGEGEDLPPWLRSFDELGVATLGCRVWPPVGDPSWQIDTELAPRRDEPVLNKKSGGTFSTTDFEQRLRAHHIDSLVVTGVVTDGCVSSTAREAADRGFKVAISCDACTAISEQLHRASLESLRFFGAVRTTSEILDDLTRLKR
jgi:nicotinamidase-related amidase